MNQAELNKVRDPRTGRLAIMSALVTWRALA